jgi:hypothetical protein
MSHFSRIQTQIVEKRFLLTAIADLGFQPEEGALQIRGFLGRTANAEIAIRLPNSYDIGFTQIDGKYDIIADWAGVKGLSQTDFTNRLTQRYAYHAAKEKLSQQGFALIEEKIEHSGQIRLVLRRITA